MKIVDFVIVVVVEFLGIIVWYYDENYDWVVVIIG